MDIKYTKIVFKNSVSIIALIAGLIAAGATIGGGVMDKFISAGCLPGQFLCPVEMYILFVICVVGGCILVIFSVPIAMDLIIAAYKYCWPRLVSFIKTANPENIQIYFDSPRPEKTDEFILAVENDEWRLGTLICSTLILRTG